jgi:hypothetical protein
MFSDFTSPHLNIVLPASGNIAHTLRLPSMRLIRSNAKRDGLKLSGPAT